MSWIRMIIVMTFLTPNPWSWATTEAGASNHGAGETENSLDKTADRLLMFVEKLPRMPILKGYTTCSNGTHLPANLTIGMYMKFWRFHRDLPPSRVFAFGLTAAKATVPGPSIVAIREVKTYVRWENHLPDEHIFEIDRTLDLANSTKGIPTVVHLHGSVSEPSSDGNARSWFTRGFHVRGEKWMREHYVYHNSRTTSNMWYHDHALGYTRINILAGLFGAYKVINPELERSLGLPEKRFDIQLVVMDRSFTRTGQIFINSTGNNPKLHPEWQPEYFGNVIIVNGKAWPYMNVQKRKYRFRIINASNARFFRFALDDGSNFIQIGSDSFYLQAPLHLKSILVAPSEIIDIVIDFSRAKKRTLILTNDAAYPFPDGDLPGERDGKLLKFLIKDKKVNDRSRVPALLQPVKKLSEQHATVSRNIVLFEFDSPTGEPTKLLINFVSFSAPVTELPRHGTTELWHIINLTPDNHPFHIHLVGFQVLYQRKLLNVDELSACTIKYKGVDACGIENYVDGEAIPPPSNEAGWKNVFKMQPFYVTSILVHFAMIDSGLFPFDPTDEPGYAYHCHILDHEDNMMMRPYQFVN
ncbi:hypothetical protein KP509_28G039300 [Ceratopteris richardii]|nr:hypothetical protein KP509_28G039300 [Ceratopteris richardii]